MRSFRYALGFLFLTAGLAHAEAIDSFHQAALWAHIPHTEAWTQAVVRVIDHRLDEFEAARDKESFCPGYARASRAQREVCWLRLVGGIVEFESGFRPDEPPFNEGNGVYSVGLMALSTGECPNAPTRKALMNPVANLICGVNKMAALIGNAGAIATSEHGGAAAYWSTLRPAHKVWDPRLRRYLHLGKRTEIMERTRGYRNY